MASDGGTRSAYGYGVDEMGLHSSSCYEAILAFCRAGLRW